METLSVFSAFKPFHHLSVSLLNKSPVGGAPLQVKQVLILGPRFVPSGILNRDVEENDVKYSSSLNMETALVMPWSTLAILLAAASLRRPSDNWRMNQEHAAFHGSARFPPGSL